MGEAIKITPNENDKDMARLRTNLKVWLVYSTDAFHSHMSQELKKCRNVHVTSFSLAAMSEEYLKSADVPELIFVEAHGNWAQKMVELQGYDLSLANMVIFEPASFNFFRSRFNKYVNFYTLFIIWRFNFNGC